MNMVHMVIAGVAGFVAGAAVAWLWASNRFAALRASLKISEHALDAERQGRADDRSANERLAADRERAFKESVRGIVAEVANATNEALKARERELAERNGEQMAHLMTPMRLQLEAVQKAADASRKANGDLGVKLEDCFKALQGTTADVGKTARDFINAVTGANKKQGNWGEAILGQMLENCGLREGEHFVAQRGGGEGIPDYQVFDPGSQKILVIDSKMSWTKYAEAYRMADGPERKAALAEHVASLRRHVDELARANYPAKQVPPRPGYGYVPLTAMFVPCDAAFQAALEVDPALTDYAGKKGVALVTPATLFGFMLLVSRAWSAYNADKNSEEIFRQAKLLVERVDRLFAALEGAAADLDKAREKQETALRLARTEAEGQCIKGPALKILALGGKPSRDLKSASLQ